MSAPSAEAMAAIDKVMRAYQIGADPDVLEDLALQLDSHAAHAVAVERERIAKEWEAICEKYSLEASFEDDARYHWPDRDTALRAALKGGA